MNAAVPSSVLRTPSPPPGEKAALHKLSAAQRLVLTRIGQGRMTKEIAAEMKISERGVSWHRTQINRKLGLRSVAEAVASAVKLGLVIL